MVGVQASVNQNSDCQPTEATYQSDYDYDQTRWDWNNSTVMMEFDDWCADTKLWKTAPPHQEAKQVYLVELQQNNHRFLKIGVSKYPVIRRFWNDIEAGRLDSVKRVASIVFTKEADALIAEKRLLEASLEYHYEPQRRFGGSEDECRSLRIKGWLIKSMRAIGADAYKHGKIFDGNLMR